MKLKDSFYYTPYQDIERKKDSFADYSKQKNYYNQLAFLFEDASSRSPHTQKEVEFLLQISKKNLGANFSFLDLACGTGRHDRILSERGFDVVGLDGSKELLKIARSKDKKTKYVQADLRQFSFADKAKCAFSLWESYNYLSQPKDIHAFFASCYEALDEGGILILDSRNFFKKGLPKHKFQERKFITDDYEVELYIKKRTVLEDKVHEGVFMYFLTNTKTGRQNLVVDQELVRVWRPSELTRLCIEKFKLIDKYGDFDVENKYDKDSSDRMILVFKKT